MRRRLRVSTRRPWLEPSMIVPTRGLSRDHLDGSTQFRNNILDSPLSPRQLVVGRGLGPASLWLAALSRRGRNELLQPTSPSGVAIPPLTLIRGEGHEFHPTLSWSAYHGQPSDGRQELCPFLAPPTIAAALPHPGVLPEGPSSRPSGCPAAKGRRAPRCAKRDRVLLRAAWRV